LKDPKHLLAASAVVVIPTH